MDALILFVVWVIWLVLYALVLILGQRAKRRLLAKLDRDFERFIAESEQRISDMQQMRRRLNGDTIITTAVRKEAAPPKD